MCSEVSANFKDIPSNKRLELFRCPVQAPCENTGELRFDFDFPKPELVSWE